MSKLIQLTKQLEIPSSSHILYIFEDTNLYLENMMSYIKAGIEEEHHVILIENTHLYDDISKRVDDLFTEQEKQFIHFTDNYEFYQCYGGFRIHNILDHFFTMLEPYLKEGLNVRTWAQVQWKDQQDIVKKIDHYEMLSDRSIKEMGIMSICAYDATKICADFQTTLMRSHEYMMTDKEFVTSSFYRGACDL